MTPITSRKHLVFVVSTTQTLTTLQRVISLTIRYNASLAHCLVSLPSCTSASQSHTPIHPTWCAHAACKARMSITPPIKLRHLVSTHSLSISIFLRCNLDMLVHSTHLCCTFIGLVVFHSPNVEVSNQCSAGLQRCQGQTSLQGLPGFCWPTNSIYTPCRGCQDTAMDLSQHTARKPMALLCPIFNGQSNTDSIVCKARQAASLHGTSPAPGLIRTESF